MSSTWKDVDKVEEYTGRVGRLAPRLAGETELTAALPTAVRRILDLGCGDGRLISVVLAVREEVSEAIGLDSSPPMLELARGAFSEDHRVTISAHDLGEPLPALGAFDVVMSGFAIHHLTDERKRSLLDEVLALLRPGGVFVNLEVVRCATPELQEEFHRLIGRAGGDPEDLLAPVEAQLDWMRDAGFHHVDCNWRWRGFALLVGRAPEASI